MKGFHEFEAGAFVETGGTDCARGGGAGAAGSSRISQGLLFDAAFFSKVIPFAPPELPIDTGVNARGAGVMLRDSVLVPSPNRVRASTVFSTFPFMLFSISVFFMLSGNPMSCRYASFVLKLLSTVVIRMPNSWLGFLCRFLGGLGGSLSRSLPVYAGERGGVKRSCLFFAGNAELVDRKLKPNRLVGLGGKSGGSSFHDPVPVPVLPVFCAICLEAGVWLRVGAPSVR